MTQARRHAAVKVKEGDVGQAVQETQLSRMDKTGIQIPACSIQREPPPDQSPLNLI